MTYDHEHDPLMLSLRRLSVPETDRGRDLRTMERCHAVLERQQRARMHPATPALAVFADAALAVLLCGYAANAVVQAVQLIVVLARV